MFFYVEWRWNYVEILSWGRFMVDGPTGPDDDKTSRFEKLLFAIFVGPCGRQQKMKKNNVCSFCRALRAAKI